MPRSKRVYTGGCLCGCTRYTVGGPPEFPHYCSCPHCQRWSGAPAVAWADFPLASFQWVGPGGEPTWYWTYPDSRRGFCPSCGGSICALDDGVDTICLTLASLDNSRGIVPISQSFKRTAPRWLRLMVGSTQRKDSKGG